ncbi:tRNA (adenosine(37)-N6)-dimethylallyltransferase MiaA [Omnitrophica bacterium]|nr:tRNA (adenosine(37)-N6)-dimethylallyltransferase MiaA [Candidatus Omnitrophota bacterium]
METEKEKQVVLFLAGPTGVGKSKIAISLARRLKGDIISADSMQVYRGMDIGTAKPSELDQEKAMHHMIDIIPPSKTFSVYEFRIMALRKIQYVLSKKRLPIVVGGSGLYLRALLDGLSEHPGENELLREKLYLEAQEKGVDYLYQRLRKVDPAIAVNTAPNNLRRIVRALEVYESSGKKLSEWHGHQQSLRDMGYAPLLVGIYKKREDLNRDLDRRVDAMFRKGLYLEVEKLSKRKLSKTAAQAVGYREILDALEGKHDLKTAKDLIKRNTRRFAKRQMTWFRKDTEMIWLLLNEKFESRECVDAITYLVHSKKFSP